ncbi:hypothetical protein ACIQWL_08765 [Streptomyces mirabilis]|uniref:hypothetical protein n=1 Tax=Streptomyces mirabilis TaxID=68239 RepID=UPI0038202A95
MLAAAEASMDAAAQDDGERARNRAKLYAPPTGAQGPRRPGARPADRGMSLDQAQALMAAVATEDAQVTGGRNG